MTGARALRGWASAWLLALLVGCAPGQKYVESGNREIAGGDVESGLADLEEAVKAEPGNVKYRMQLARQREAYVNNLLTQADRYRAAEQYDEAKATLERIVPIDPNNARARTILEAIAIDRRHQLRIEEARALSTKGHPDEARTLLERVLAEDPANPRALALRHQIDDADPRSEIPLGLRAQLRKPVSLEFRDANIKAVFEALSRSTDVNFVFDREVKPDLKVTVFLQNTNVEDAISVLTVTNQLEKKYLNENTILIYPSTAAKQKDYQDLAVKTFYLANADARSIANMLKTVLKTRDLYADEKLNSVTVRDTPAAVRLVDKLIAAQDLAEPEVTLEVEVLEVSRTRLTELGVNPPAQFTLLNIVPSPTTTVAANGTVVTNVNPVTTTSQLTVDNLRHITGGSIGIPNPQVNIHSELGDTNLLANPRIRVKNKDKAHILIGDKVPVITTTSTANVGVSESVSYLDVGLKLDVQPVVYLNNDVSIAVALEVSSITKQITTQTGTLTYQIGTRSATTSLRLQDGETQVLAGLINDQERHSAQGVPGLIDIPIVNRLFSTGTDQHDKTEIVLLITPHVIRNIARSEETLLSYPSGTESEAGAPILRLQTSSKISIPPRGDNPSGPGAASGSSDSNASGSPAEPEPSPPVPAPEPAAVAPAGAPQPFPPAKPALLPESKPATLGPADPGAH